MQNHTAESLKSLEGYHCAWVEQAEMLSQASFDILRPTIRAQNSELWFSWNPRRRVDPVDAFFRQGTMPTNAVCVMSNWRDNQWFNKTMEAERLECLRNQPEQYDHIWEGDYQKIVAGAITLPRSRRLGARAAFPSATPSRCCRSRRSGMSAALAPRPTIP